MDLEYYLKDRIKSANDIDGSDGHWSNSAWKMPKSLEKVDYDRKVLMSLYTLAINKKIKDRHSLRKKLKISKYLDHDDIDFCVRVIKGLFGDLDKVPLSLNKYKGVTKDVILWRLNRGI